MITPLPPLNAIRAFEAAIRHLNFASAAEELGVSQSAVSKQIATLEDFIGGRLFERESRGVSLTLEGRELSQTVLPAFDLLRQGFQRYSRRPPRSGRVRLATVTSFASLVLMPRLAEFDIAFPDLNLEILTSDRVLDMAREEIDFSVRYGKGQWDGLVSVPLTPGRLIPVCHPSVSTGSLDDLANDLANDLAGQRRIQLFSQNEWHAWDAENPDMIDLSEPPFLTEHFLVGLQGAISGSGYALIPDIIAREALVEGRVKTFGAPIQWPETFYLTYLPQTATNRVLKPVMDWLQTLGG